ncbi:ACBP domain-containing protein [Rhizoctonia solani AG-1 IA]|uniref:ACBP domain-containing protein n=1 Tax=Thanatephorus cucumeris (strain AG1-IA) TaxID=983506 RepID=L8WV26_THACA|nr:ACBP domain-containing protein [Rhizoctonia solani AG-1 IA]
MSQAKFDKAASVVQSLPKDGPIKPTQDDQLKVSLASYAICVDNNLPHLNTVLFAIQTR